MRIAFDAKRAFQNTTGLGNYSRVLFDRFAQDFPQHEYYLMAPKLTDNYKLPKIPNMHVVTPSGIDKMFPSVWRSNWVKEDLKKRGIQLYHGLSHEIPIGIQHTGIKSVVTMHDLIFEYFPEQYKPLDVQMYRGKFKNACANADRVIAISNKTREDLINMYKVPEEKITVCYQSCDSIYERVTTEEEREIIKAKYRLPEKYFLNVGSIIERKNLLNVCKALNALKDRLDTPLVVIGSGNNKYAAEVKAYLKEQQMEDRVIFLEERPEAKEPDFKNSRDFPAIYQAADMLLYPSIYEGFGLPVLEALWSRLPIITSNTSCLPETGGNAALYIDPTSVDELAEAILQVSVDDSLRLQMSSRGILHAQKFAPKLCAANVMKVYEDLFQF